MLPTSRGLPPLDQVCAKHGAHLAYRLRGEYLPGAAPFPDSPEEVAWLAKRESIVLTVLAVDARCLVQVAWTAGGVERCRDLELASGEALPWIGEIEARGGWAIPAFSAISVGEGTVELEHEAYEYRDSDPDSLDLESWAPPRHWRTMRGGNGASAAGTRQLAAAYARFLPEEARHSPIAEAFRG